MNQNRLIPLVLLFALFAGIPPVRAGGWSVATLDRLPDTIIAGEPVTVGFTIRQHGSDDRVLSDLAPVITATLVERRYAFWVDLAFPVRRSARPHLTITLEHDSPGHYTGQLVFPTPGVWHWTIAAFGPDQAMPPLTVQPADAAGAARAARFAGDELAARGSQLFVAKGCSSCHEHSDSGVQTYASINRGPELTNYQGDAAFLRAWLRDPAAVAPRTAMPDLDLSAAEIDALIAFLNAGTRAAYSN